VKKATGNHITKRSSAALAIIGVSADDRDNHQLFEMIGSDGIR
jgi:hypothetical protein